MKSHKESPEQRELWEAMDTVIGASSLSLQVAEQPATTEEEIQPILDRIGKREKQRSYAAKAAA